jgi:hypothetical protein
VVQVEPLVATTQETLQLQTQAVAVAVAAFRAEQLTVALVVRV